LNFKNLFSISLTLYAVVATYANAETRYVTDNMMVPLRSGAGSEFRIINSRITSGTQLQLLDEPPGDWANVRLPSGTEGWMRKQYLQRTPVAKTLLDQAQKKEAAAQVLLASKTAQLTELQSKYAELHTLSTRLEQENTTLGSDFQNLKVMSEDAINLSTRYRDLLADHEVLLTQHDALKAENDNLRSDQTISHGLYAIALLMAGMVIAIILPMLRPRKRYSDQIL
jgi:SH3 domain protein